MRSVIDTVARWVAIAATCTAAEGCAAQNAADTKRAAVMPWWVASPSAPLPAGFPAPSPPGEVEIKQYPAYRAVLVKATPERPTTNSMFYPLFKHIEKNHVAMSSPVEITYDGPDDAAPAAMAFIYGTPTTGHAGPDGPTDVVDVAAMTVASLGITGAYTDSHFKAACERLTAWLDRHPEYRASGRPRYLAYNSPFVLPFMRYGEVQLPITVTPLPSLQTLP